MLVVIDMPMAVATNVGSHLVYGIRFCFANWSLVDCGDSGPKEEANVVCSSGYSEMKA